MTGLLAAWVLLLLALVAHEAGHVFAGRLCGYRFDGLVGHAWPPMVGVRLVGDDPSSTPAWNRAALVAAAGPLANLVMAEVLWICGQPGAGVAAFGLLNLLPLRGSDGRRVAAALVRGWVERRNAPLSYEPE